MKRFNYRLGDIEARSYRTVLLQDNESTVNTSLEIVRWQNDGSCYTLAFITHDKKEESYDLQSVGNRPFEDTVDPLDFMTVAKAVFRFLENI